MTILFTTNLRIIACLFFWYLPLDFFDGRRAVFIRIFTQLSVKKYLAYSGSEC